jgi:hypothetical protein
VAKRRLLTYTASVASFTSPIHRNGDAEVCLQGAAHAARPFSPPHCQQPRQTAPVTVARLCCCFRSPAQGMRISYFLEILLIPNSCSPPASKMSIPPSTRSSKRSADSPHLALSTAHQARIAGEESPEALHKSHPLREFHLASCSRCARQCNAEYVTPPTALTA